MVEKERFGGDTMLTLLLIGIAGLAVVSQLRHRYRDSKLRQRQELRERIGRHTSGLDARAAVAEAERILARKAS